jgi:L-ascorbate metabolism protein UlaG (beta-lactamase superfamily)
VDVVLALAGAHATIALDDLDRAIAAIAPRIVVPMHYWHPRGVLRIEPVDRFLQRHSEDMIIRRNGPSLTIDPDHLPAACEIIVLDQTR